MLLKGKIEKMNLAVLLSGGVDSCVAVHLLCEQGYRPDLFYIYIGADEKTEDSSCASEDDLLVCRMMARKYGLKFEIINLHNEYHSRVVGYMMENVMKGFTPNSDVMCNRLIKFGAFDDKIGHCYDKIVTGHYARTVEREGFTWLATAADRLKDQTDFLCRINVPVSHLLFPLGDLQKQEVRHIAEEALLPSAKRKDSQGICFLGKINFSNFLKAHVGEREGDIVELETGKVLGQHKGFWYYTIGQRKGIFLSGGPWFVVKKDVDKNIVYISKGTNSIARFKREISLGNLLSLGPNGLLETLDNHRITFKIRHVQKFTMGLFYLKEDGKALILSDKDVQGVAPGQFCTVYDKDANLCLCSGEIIL